jgi:predicted Zn-dependent peptidase
MYHDSGAFIIHMGLNKDKIPVALSAILGQLNKIKEDQVSAKELLRAKDYLLGQFAMSLEQPQSRMFYLAQEYITQSKIADFDSLKKNVDLITPTEIKRVAKNIFKFKDICISCVGNIEDDIKEKLKNTVKKGGLYS